MMNGNNKGNPYHDENGHFTSKDNQGSGNGGTEKVNPQKVLGQMGLNANDIRNATYEAKRDLAYKNGWTPDREGNPKNDVDHFLINKSLDNLKKGYGVGDESPVNKEWAEDLGYQLKNDGVPEEAIPGLLETFKAEAPSWEEVNKRISDQKALDDLGAKMDKLKFGDSNGSTQTSWSSRHNPTPEQESQLNRIVNSVFPNKDWKYVADNTDSPRDINLAIEEFLETGHSEYLLNVLKSIKQRYDDYGRRI